MNTQKQQDGAALAPTIGYALEYVPQWQEQLGWRLYPASHVDMPEPTTLNGTPLWESRDGLVCRVTVHLSWLDRLRMLVSGRLEVTAKTATENALGRHVTASGVSVRPPAWLDRRNTV